VEIPPNPDNNIRGKRKPRVRQRPLRLLNECLVKFTDAVTAAKAEAGSAKSSQFVYDSRDRRVGRFLDESLVFNPIIGICSWRRVWSAW
jgi:hypothetical protein